MPAAPAPASAEEGVGDGEPAPLPPRDIGEQVAAITSGAPARQAEGMASLLGLLDAPEADERERDSVLRALFAEVEGEKHRAWVERQAEVERLKADDAYDSEEEREPDPEPALLCPQGIADCTWPLLSAEQPAVREAASKLAKAASRWPLEYRKLVDKTKLMDGLWANVTYVDYDVDEETEEKTAKPPTAELERACMAAADAMSAWVFIDDDSVRYVVEIFDEEHHEDGDIEAAKIRGKAPLVRLLAWDRSPEVVLACTRLIWYLGRDAVVREQLVEACVTHALTAVLQPKPLPPPPADEAKQEPEEEPEREFRPDDCIVAACDALARYLGNPSWVQSDAIAAGIVASLVDHMARDDLVELQISAANALGNLMWCSRDACQMFYQSACFPVLWSMLPKPPSMPVFIEIEEPEDTTERDLLFMKAPFLNESEKRLEEARIVAIEEGIRKAKEAIAAEAALLTTTELKCPGPALDPTLQTKALFCLQAILAEPITRTKLEKKQNIVHVLLYMLTPPPDPVEEEEEGEEGEAGEGGEGQKEGEQEADEDVKTDDEIAAELALVTKTRDDAVIAYAKARNAVLKIDGIAELRSYHRPPPSCKTVVQAVLQVVGEPLETASDWNRARRQLNRAIVAKIVAIDASRNGGTVGEDIVNPKRKAWKKAAKVVEGLDEEQVLAASAAAHTMLVWLRAGAELCNATVEAERLQIEAKELPEPGVDPEATEEELAAAAKAEAEAAKSAEEAKEGEEGEGEGEGEGEKDEDTIIAETPEELIPPFSETVRGAAAVALQCAAMQSSFRRLLSDNNNGELNLLFDALTEDCPASVADPMALLITALVPHCDSAYLEECGVLRTLCALAKAASNNSMRSAVARAIMCFDLDKLLAPLKEVPPLPPPKPPPRPLPIGAHLWDALGAKELAQPLNLKPGLPGRVN